MLATGVRVQADIEVNPAYKRAMKDRSRYLILYGGAGSGKSVFAAQKILLRVLKEPGHRILVVRKVAKTLRNSTFALFRDLIGEYGLTGVFVPNKTDMEITCLANGNQILHAGLDDVEKLKSVQGITSVWIEEASEITPQDFRQLDLRLRGKTPTYKQIILTFNPVSALSWLKTTFFDTPKDNAAVLKTTYQDNEFIDDEYKAVIEALVNEDYVYYQVYALGEWGVLGNLIYTNWTVKEIPTAGEFYDDVLQGLDFGFNNPSAWVVVGTHDNEIYIYDEFKAKGLTNAGLIQALAGQARKQYPIIADSAEPARIAEWKLAGYKIRPALKGTDSVKHGIDWLRTKKMYIHPRCTELIKELQGYKYREDRDGNVLDEPAKVDDHLCDSLRYSIDPLRKHRGLKVSLGLDSFTRESPNIL